jgi:hypothetical protein
MSIVKSLPLQINPLLDRYIAELEKEASQKEGVLEFIVDPQYLLFKQEQKFFFLLYKTYGSTWDWRAPDDNEWARLLCIKAHTNFSNMQENEIEQIMEIAEQHGIICLHEQIPSQFPKLIIGCGHSDPNNVYHLHAHQDADTIDRLLDTNPTWVGEFGKNSNMEHLIENCANYYHIIVDEGALSKCTQKTWNAVEKLLKPGGFFLCGENAFAHSDDFPENSLLDQQWVTVESEQNMMKYYVVTKANNDHTHPDRLQWIHIPLNVRSDPPPGCNWDDHVILFNFANRDNLTNYKI